MLVKLNAFRFYLLGLLMLSAAAQAETPTLKEFKPGSYQQLLTANQQQPFMLVIWSITCSSCLKDMALLNTVHKHYPKFKIIMLATDDASANEQIQQILTKNQLTGLENWRFADENSQKLQYEIDPKWYGELPRTYFFDKSQQRQGVSGVLQKADYDEMITKLLQ